MVDLVCQLCGSGDDVEEVERGRLESGGTWKPWSTPFCRRCLDLMLAEAVGDAETETT